MFGCWWKQWNRYFSFITFESRWSKICFFSSFVLSVIRMKGLEFSLAFQSIFFFIGRFEETVVDFDRKCRQNRSISIQFMKFHRKNDAQILITIFHRNEIDILLNGFFFIRSDEMAIKKNWIKFNETANFIEFNQSFEFATFCCSQNDQFPRLSYFIQAKNELIGLKQLVK